MQDWRRRWESNPLVEVLQTSAFPLGYSAVIEPGFLTEKCAVVNGQSCAQFTNTIGGATSRTPAATSGTPSVWSSAETRLFSKVTDSFPAGTFT